jgi:V-type H+-transporting ATPase subunit C
MSKPNSISTTRSRPILLPHSADKRLFPPAFPLGSYVLMDDISGNLSTKSLTSIVPPSALIRDSEYLETHLIAVPRAMVKEFLKSYETLTEMVVPRSAQDITSDDEFTLYAVTTFKKVSPEFTHKCREKRWVPRDYKYKEGGKEEEQKEVESLEKEERKVWGEALRLGRTGYSESAMVWVHVLALRVFVETVLRYGLPLDFVCGLVQVSWNFIQQFQAVTKT